MVRLQSIKRKFPFSILFPPGPQGVPTPSGSTINPALSVEHDDHGQNLLRATTDRRAQQQAGQARTHWHCCPSAKLGIHAHTSSRTLQHFSSELAPGCFVSSTSDTTGPPGHSLLPTAPHTLPQRLPFPTKWRQAGNQCFKSLLLWILKSSYLTNKATFNTHQQGHSRLSWLSALKDEAPHDLWPYQHRS